MAAFWQEALHYVPRESAEEGWVVLKDPLGSSPNVSVNQKSKPVSGKIRLHLDLYTSGQNAEVERLLKTGATLIRRPEKDEEDRKSTRLNSSHIQKSRMPSSA